MTRSRSFMYRVHHALWSDYHANLGFTALLLENYNSEFGWGNWWIAANSFYSCLNPDGYVETDYRRMVRYWEKSRRTTAVLRCWLTPYYSVYWGGCNGGSFYPSAILLGPAAFWPKQKHSEILWRKKFTTALINLLWAIFAAFWIAANHLIPRNMPLFFLRARINGNK